MIKKAIYLLIYSLYNKCEAIKKRMRNNIPQTIDCQIVTQKIVIIPRHMQTIVHKINSTLSIVYLIIML